MPHRYVIIILICCALAPACDTVRPVEFDEEPVVEAYLVTGEPVPIVRLTRTAPLDVIHDVGLHAIHGADVVVHRLDSDGQVERTYRYRESVSNAGTYVPLVEDQVRPLTRYRFEADLPDGAGRLESETITPGAFDLVQASHDTLRYQAGEQLQMTITASSYPGRQSIYILTTEADDPSFENLTPVYRAIVEEGDLTPADFRTGASPLLNEGGYDHNDRGEIVLRMPWLAVPFYGLNTVNINVIDDNLYDFLRTHAVQQGGSTLPPGEIPDVIDHVNGGRGVFGSFARVSHEIVVMR